jgi:CDP-diacylglycerol--inositol 3-phosphatidyltransferase
VLFIACALNELFFIALYLLCFSSPFITPALLPANGSPGNGTSPAGGSPVEPFQPAPSLLFPSPFSAAAMEMARANKMDSRVPWVLTVASSPVMIFKQVVNVLQLWNASKWLAEGDRRDRKKAGLDVKASRDKKRR